MPRGRDLILKALDNLNEDEFKRFKNKLLTVPLRDGYCHIPRGTLQALDRVDLTDKIVSYYLESYGLKVTVQVLQDIGMREEAVTLQQAAGAGIHFVDKHWTDFINYVIQLDPVLDKLCGNVLNEEQCQEVRAEDTNLDKMRKLYSFMEDWDLSRKDLFLKALKET
ncbi:apoptosis-associated speck-like protein containing a CARD isoform X2 [Petaurus breviceps papuanus]|uniref:apoptosis-associated speck-like protein containing a CARD isoform X2 n=1 Tax=Petaurus breviceps papuanus TaxID=3040969 RepID=UPI0036DBF572